MAIDIVGQEFYDQWNGIITGKGSDLLTGNVGDEITAKIEIDVNWHITGGGDADTAIVLTNNGLTGTITRLDGGDWSADEFAVNDIVEVAGTTSNNFLFKVLALDESVATVERYPTPVNPTIVSSPETDENARISGVTPIDRIDYRFNLIDNTDEPYFDSRIDESEQRFAAKSLDGTNTVGLVSQSASNAWLTGTTTQLDPDQPTPSNRVECNGVDSVVGSEDVTGRDLGRSQLFTIYHTFTITPEFLAEYTDAQGNFRHEDLYDDISFKYAYAIDARYEDVSLSQIRRQTTDSVNSNLNQYLDWGNVGGFDEQLNGEAPYYSFQNLVITDIDNVEVVDKLRGANRTQFDLELTSTEANLSTSNVIEIRLYKIPVDADDEEDNYKETTTTYFENYDYSSIRITADGTPLSGLTGIEAEKQNHFEDGATATFVSGSQIDVSFVVEAGFGSNRYAIVLATQDPAIDDSSSTDRNNILLQIDTAEDDLSDPSVLTTTIGQLEFAQTDTADTTTGLKSFPKDNIVGVVDFAVDTAKNSLIQTISAVIVAKHTTLGEFEVERADFDVSNTKVSGGIQQINIVDERNFNMPSGDIRKVISIQRDSANDTGSFAAYQMLYPYKIRWEDFISNDNVNEDEFFDSNELNDGLNQEWFRIEDKANWSFYFRFETLIDNDGFENNLSVENQIEVVDYESNTDWTVSIETFDEAFTNNLSGATQSSEDTWVRATFTYTGGETITTANSYVILSVESYRGSGITEVREINSLYVNEPSSVWESINGDGLALFTDLGGGVFTAEAILKAGSYTEGSLEYSARIGPQEVTLATPPNAILQENGFFWLQEDGSYIIQE